MEKVKTFSGDNKEWSSKKKKTFFKEICLIKQQVAK